MIKTNDTMQGYIYKWEDTFGNTGKKISPESVKEQIDAFSETDMWVYLNYPTNHGVESFYSPDISSVVGFAKLSYDGTGIFCTTNIPDTPMARILKQIYTERLKDIVTINLIMTGEISDDSEYIKNPCLLCINVSTHKTYHKYIPIFSFITYDDVLN